jgi:hypothetical protein
MATVGATFGLPSAMPALALLPGSAYRRETEGFESGF